MANKKGCPEITSRATVKNLKVFSRFHKLRVFNLLSSSYGNVGVTVPPVIITLLLSPPFTDIARPTEFPEEF